ncbi:TetR/AcrR family transcriptional regulator C-terminal domain-containing protein [Streptomyces canus]|uniref:TetR/AcrR family transcriptional regulator C-terminal domain-containing protein n=1 Tax=Streptomyces canus TaxID=58343 RepID=UPI000997E89D
MSRREATTVTADSFYESLRRHPRAVPLPAAQVHVGPNGLRVRERLIGLLLSHGFSTGLAARTFTVLGHYVIGLAIRPGPGHLPGHVGRGRRPDRRIPARRKAGPTLTPADQRGAQPTRASRARVTRRAVHRATTPETGFLMKSRRRSQSQWYRGTTRAPKTPPWSQGS